MEHYITIENHPNYEVSNFGNVRNKKTGTIRQLTNRNGYKKIRLNNKDESVHRLVADAFFDGKHDDLQVNHIDGNKSNNHLGNLEWCTSSENIKHAYATGLKRPSGGTPRKKIFDEDTGIVYDNAKECGESLDGTGSGVLYAIKHNGKYKGHRLRYFGETYEGV